MADSEALHLFPRPLTANDIEIHPNLTHNLSTVHLDSFLTNKVYRAIYPTGITDPAPYIQANIERHTNVIRSDPSSHYLVVVHGELPILDIGTDSATDSTSPHVANGDCWCTRIVAMAKYNHFTTAAEQDSRKDTTERIWPTGTNVLLVNAFWGRILEVRRKWGPRLGAHVGLDLLATSPGYMGKGAGGMLVRKVAEVCDADGLPGFLEGSPEGLRVYEKGGWRDTGERVRVDLGRFEGGVDHGEGWRKDEQMVEGREGGGKGWYENCVMVRPARGKAIEEYLAD